MVYIKSVDQCVDGFKDTYETDIDCGGVCAATRKCPLNSGCANDGDCLTGACSINNTCAGKQLR